MAERLTHVEIAAELEISPQRLYKLKKDRTPNRELAAKLARYLGGRTDDYLRPQRRMGRPRSSTLYPFREFILEFEPGDVEDDPCADLIADLATMYTGREGSGIPMPREVESLEALSNFIRTERLETESRDAAALLWQRFKSWRVRQGADHIIFSIETGDDVDDEVVRSVLRLCEMA